MNTLFAKITHMLFGIKWVFLIDIDGDVNLRRVLKMGNIRLARRVGFGIRTVRLLPNGKIDNGIYVSCWEPAFPNDGDLS